MSIFQELAKPFPPEAISWRVGNTNSEKTKGMALAYLDARDVMDRLDEVIGPANWQCKYSHASGKTICDIGIRVAPEGEEFAQLNPEWVWKADGAGDTDFEAEKGAMSDAFKRAAVRWGIGRYLYGLASPWVEIEQRGKSYVIKESEKKRLAAMLGKSAPAVDGTDGLHRPHAAQDAHEQYQKLKEIADGLASEISGAQTMKELQGLGIQVKRHPFDSYPEIIGALRAAYEERKVYLAVKEGK